MSRCVHLTIASEGAGGILASGLDHGASQVLGIEQEERGSGFEKGDLIKFAVSIESSNFTCPSGSEGTTKKRAAQHLWMEMTRAEAASILASSQRTSRKTSVDLREHPNDPSKSHEKFD